MQKALQWKMLKVQEKQMKAQMELLLAEAGEEAEAEAQALLREAKRAALERRAALRGAAR